MTEPKHKVQVVRLASLYLHFARLGDPFILSLLRYIVYWSLFTVLPFFEKVLITLWKSS